MQPPKKTMLEDLRKDLDRLAGTTIEIYGQGEYPVKARTPVQKVAKWQNDGTEKIRPALFVQSAERRHRGWQSPVFKAIGQIMFKDANFEQALTEAGLRISYDINNAVNRIRTGRLKKSMRPRIVESGDTGRGRYYSR
jgi:hypothetical protein